MTVARMYWHAEYNLNISRVFPFSAMATFDNRMGQEVTRPGDASVGFYQRK